MFKKRLGGAAQSESAGHPAWQQPSPDVHAVISVFWHRPAVHVSVVHGLPSLHSLASVHGWPPTNRAKTSLSLSALSYILTSSMLPPKYLFWPSSIPMVNTPPSLVFMGPYGPVLSW
jgi:hypothetical protein